MKIEWNTVTSFVNEGITLPSVDIVVTQGFNQINDGGAIKLQRTGQVGAPSQTFINTGSNTCTDANGDEWEISEGTVIEFNGIDDWFGNGFGSNCKTAYTLVGGTWIDKATSLEQRLVDPLGGLFKGTGVTNGERHVQLGDTVPAGTTAITALIDGSTVNLILLSAATGSITSIDSYSATIGNSVISVCSAQELTQLRSIAIANNTTINNVAFLFGGATLNGEEYLRVINEEKTYFVAGGVTSTVSLITENGDGTKKITTDNKEYVAKNVNIIRVKYTTDSVLLSLKIGDVVVSESYSPNSNNLGGSNFIVTDINANHVDTPIAFKSANNAVLTMQHNGIVSVEQAGVIPLISTDEVRTLNDSVLYKLQDVEDINEIHFYSGKYYFHRGIDCSTRPRAKFFDGGYGTIERQASFYFDQVTENNRPATLKSTLTESSDLNPVIEPNRDNTAIFFGQKSAPRIGRGVIRNIRLINDGTNNPAKNKSDRKGVGYFFHGGHFEMHRVYTEGFDIGGYENSWTRAQSFVEHKSFNTGFVLIGGTSSHLEGIFANGNNYDEDANNFDVTYTDEEVDNFMGYGYVFHNVFYSNFSSLACDKIQRAYAIVGNSTDSQMSYVFDGCGSEFTEYQFVIDAPNARVIVDGGSQWGNNIIDDVAKIHIRGRRFPVITSSKVTASQIVQDDYTFFTSSQASGLAEAEMSVPLYKGYNGLYWQRTRRDENFIYWSVRGRIETSEFQMRYNTATNGYCNGSLRFNLSAGNSSSEMSSSTGEVKFNYLRSLNTVTNYFDIDQNLNVTTSISGDYRYISKPSQSVAHLVTVDVDIEIKTNYRDEDFTKKATRPDLLYFLGIDY